MPVSSINIIVAATRDGGIGRNGDLLYHIGADLKRFKALTMGHTIVMGRKTFESLPNGALPGRRNIVLTRQSDYSAPDIETAPDLSTVLNMTHGKLFIIGGASVYAEAMPLASRLHLTRIYADCADADARIAPIGPEWQLTEAGPLTVDPRSGVEYRFEDYRKQPDSRVMNSVNQ